MNSGEFVLQSSGLGVNSVALTSRWLREGRRLDGVIVADTMAEHRYTYEFLRDYYEPFLKAEGVPLYMAMGDRGDLIDWHEEKGLVPSVQYRICSVEWKVKPMTRLALQLMDEAGVGRADMLVGFAKEEMVKRAKDNTEPRLTNVYPLSDWGMSRADCEAEIAARGWPSPGKSGCVGCPFAGAAGAAEALLHYPERFKQMKRAEAAARLKNKKVTWLPNEWPLHVIEKRIRDQRVLPGFDLGGECMPAGCSVEGLA